MNITIAIVYVDDTPKARVEGEYLVELSENSSSGADIDYNRRALETAFGEVFGSNNVEVLFPELGECLDDTN